MNICLEVPKFEEVVAIEKEIHEVSSFDYKSASNSKQYSESFKQYINEICTSYPRVTDEELLRLFYLAHNGDECARNKIIESNLRFVIYLAFKYIKSSKLEIEDLIQEGNIGLLESINRFDPEKGFKFSTFAYWYIKGNILRAIGNMGSTIRIPISIYEKIKKLDDLSLNIYEETGITPSIEELSLRTGIKRETIIRLKQLKSLSSLNEKLKINVTIDEEEVPFEISTIETIIDEEEDCFEKVTLKMRLEELEKIMQNMLFPREKQIIILRFGFDDGEIKSLETVSAMTGFTKERVRQIEAKALRKLRRYHSAKTLRGYL